MEPRPLRRLRCCSEGARHEGADGARARRAQRAERSRRWRSEVYLSLPAWDRGPLASELSEAAAELASHIGAPVFGGNILSSVVSDVAPALLSGHLLKAAELYLEGDDIARTRLVIEYARTRLGKRMTGRWVVLEKKLAARVASEEEAAAQPPLKIDIDAEAVARELAAARAASARAAQLARAETAPKKQGDKP